MSDGKTLTSAAAPAEGHLEQTGSLTCRPKQRISGRDKSYQTIERKIAFNQTSMEQAVSRGHGSADCAAKDRSEQVEKQFRQKPASRSKIQFWSFSRSCHLAQPILMSVEVISS